MATKDATNTSNLPAFSSIKGHERRAVILRAEGKSYQQITSHINNEFVLDYAEITVREWFYAGGRLEQAYAEYLEAEAHMSLQEARSLIKRATKVAASNMIRKIGSSDERISLDASRHLLNKYIPDRQIVADSPEQEADLPDELKAAAEAVREAEHGQDAVDEPPVGDPNPANPGQ